MEGDARAQLDRGQVILRIHQDPVGFIDLCRDALCHGMVHAGDDHGKFIAADPAHDIHGPEAPAQDAGHALEDAVADVVAVGVIDSLELVHIHDHQSAVCQIRVLEEHVIGTAVIDPGQRIVHGLIGELVLLPSVGDQDLVIGIGDKAHLLRPGRLGHFLQTHLRGCLRQRTDHLGADKEDQKEHDQEHDDGQHGLDPQEPVHIGICPLQFLTGLLDQGLCAAVDMEADLVLEAHVDIVKDQLLGPLMPVRGRKRQVLRGELYIPDLLRDSVILQQGIPLRGQLQPHGPVLPLQQFIGKIQGHSQALIGPVAGPALQQLFQAGQGIVPALCHPGLRPEILQIIHLAGHDKAPDPVRQIIGSGLHVRSSLPGQDIAVTGLFHAAVSPVDHGRGYKEQGGGQDRDRPENEIHGLQADPGPVQLRGRFFPGRLFTAGRSRFLPGRTCTAGPGRFLQGCSCTAGLPRGRISSRQIFFIPRQFPGVFVVSHTCLPSQCVFTA